MSPAIDELRGWLGRFKAYVAAEAKRDPQARVRLSFPMSLSQAPHAPDSGRAASGSHDRLPDANSATLAPGSPRPEPPWAPTLSEFQAQVCACQRCPLGATRKSFVFGEGDPQARLVFVGEAPGADEDLAGRPFVGAAGRLLDKVIAAMGLKREQVYILNVLKCRPPGNRDPRPEEVAECRPYLEQQLALLKPKVIVALGKFSANALLKLDQPISGLRGRFFEAYGAKVMPTFHPAALLRDANLKRHVWDDMKLVVAALAEGGER